jgi:hypothetical protein
MIFKQNERQKIIQKVGNNNTGTFQAINADRDVYVNQLNRQATSSKEITQSKAIEYLEKIEKLIKEAKLASEAEVVEILEEATDCASDAKKAAQRKEPSKSPIVANLERATSLLQKMNQATDATKELIDKLKPWLVKLTSWLGVAVNHFFG